MDTEPGRLRAVPAERNDLRPLPGRAPECRRIAEALDSTDEHAKRALLLRGVRGIGKTSMLRWAADLARRRRWSAVIVRPPRVEGLTPHELIGDVIAGLSSGPPAIAVSGGTPTALRSARMLMASTGSPALVLLDDAHVIPTPAIRLLADAIRLADMTAVLVASVVAGEGDPAAALGSGGDLWVDLLDLGGLPEDAVDALTREMAGARLAPALVRRLHRETAGNPLYIRETMRGWLDAGILEQVGPYLDARDAVPPLPVSLAAAVAQTIAALGPDHLRICSILAMLGRDAAFLEIQQAAGAAAPIVARALDELVERGVLVRTSGRPTESWGLGNALTQSSLLATMRPADADDVTAGIVAMLRARALDGAPGLATELATHADRLLEPPVDLAALLQAGAEEALGTQREFVAADLFGRLAGLERDPPARSRWLRLRANAFLRAAPQRAVEAVAEARTAVAGVDDGVAAELDHLEGNALLSLGRPGDAAEVLARAAERDAPQDLQAQIRFGLACARVMAGDKQRARPILEELFGSGFARAAGTLAYIEGEDGRIESALELLAGALAGDVDGRERSFLRTSLAAFQVLAGRWQDALATIAAVSEEADRAGDQYVLSTVAGTAARLHAWRGEFDEALAITGEALRVARAAGDRGMIAEACLAWLAIHTETGQLAQAIPFARAEIEDHRDELGRKDLALFEIAMASALLAAGESGDALTYVERAGERLDREPLWRVRVDRVRAEIALARDDVAGARAAVAPWLAEPSEAVFEQAQTMLVAAEAERRLRRKAAARDLATAAREVFERLGAARRLAEARAWLDEHVGTSARAPKAGPNDLSTREAEIARLAVDGLTNAEIAERLVISAGTVKKHMERVLSKTGARRRADLHRHL